MSNSRPDTIDYLDSLQGRGIRPGLRRVRALLRAAGHPERAAPAVIVAGTNGKGSTAATLASIITSAGYRCALYSSPHLVHLRERWMIDGQPVSPAELKRAVDQLRKLSRRAAVRPTYFEALTVVAFLLFRERMVDLMVLEVGMGGRLDATNVVRPLLSLITSIGFDHTEFLGSNLRSIAREKAGVIHRGSIALTSNRDPQILEVLRKRASAVAAPLQVISERIRATEIDSSHGALRFTLSTPARLYQLRSPLPGLHQVENIALAVQAAETMEGRFPRITASRIEQGVRKTNWKGRLQRLFVNGKMVWIDGGHNTQAAGRIAEFADAYLPRGRTLVFGILRDKEVEKVASILFPRFDRIILTEPPSSRAATVADLAKLAARWGMPHRNSKRPAMAFRMALEESPSTILVFGSLYLAGDAVKFFERRAAAASRSTIVASQPAMVTR